MNQNDNAVPVALNKNVKIVYAIPAKPKPRQPWWKQNADGLLLIWGCVVLMIYLWFNP